MYSWSELRILVWHWQTSKAYSLYFMPIQPQGNDFPCYVLSVGMFQELNSPLHMDPTTLLHPITTMTSHYKYVTLILGHELCFEA